MTNFTRRIATEADIPALVTLMDRSLTGPLAAFLTPPASAPCTRSEFARRGVGRMILGLCGDAARVAGYDSAELVATLGGEPLYRAAGYHQTERFDDDRCGAPVPLVRMGKRLAVGRPGEPG